MKLKTLLRHRAACAIVLLLLNLVLAPSPVRAADEPGLVDRTKETVKEAAVAAEDAAKKAGRTAAYGLDHLWSRVDENRLKNRTRDEIVAWVIMGVLVGAVAGMFTSLRTSGAGKMGRLLLGLAGALIGGMVVHVAKIDYGWGPVMIRYEELLFSLLGAVVLVLLARLIRSKAKKQAD